MYENNIDWEAMDNAAQNDFQNGNDGYGQDNRDFSDNRNNGDLYSTDRQNAVEQSPNPSDNGGNSFVQQQMMDAADAKNAALADGSAFGDTPNPNYTPTGQDTLNTMQQAAEAHNRNLANGTAVGDTPSPLSTNTGTFPGNYQTGQLNDTVLNPLPDTRIPNMANNGPSVSSNAPSPATNSNIPNMSNADTRSSGTLTDAQRIVQDAQGNAVGVRSDNGYYDPNFQSKSNMLDNAQRGDVFAIRDLNILAKAGDADAQKVLGDIAANPGYSNSGIEQSWIAGHNSQINNELAGNTFGNNQAARQNLAGQELNPITSVQDVTQALPQAAQLMDVLKNAGMTNVSLQLDANSPHLGQVSWQNSQGQTKYSSVSNWGTDLAAAQVAVGTNNTNTPTVNNNRTVGNSNLNRGVGNNYNTPTVPVNNAPVPSYQHPVIEDGNVPIRAPDPYNRPLEPTALDLSQSVNRSGSIAGRPGIPY